MIALFVFAARDFWSNYSVRRRSLSRSRCAKYWRECALCYLSERGRCFCSSHESQPASQVCIMTQRLFFASSNVRRRCIIYIWNIPATIADQNRFRARAKTCRLKSPPRHVLHFIFHANNLDPRRLNSSIETMRNRSPKRNKSDWQWLKSRSQLLKVKWRTSRALKVAKSSHVCNYTNKCTWR